MRLLGYLIPPLLTLLVLSTMVSGGSCESCHNAYNPSGEYIYVPPDFLLDLPPKIPPKSRFSIGFIVSVPAEYGIERGNAEIICRDLKVLGDKTKRFSVSAGDAEKILWDITGDTEGNFTVEIKIKYTVRYNHEGSASYNTYTYETSLSDVVVIKNVSIVLSTYSIAFREGISSLESFEIICKKDVKNITIKASESLKDEVKIFPAHIKHASSGTRIKINVTSTPTTSWDMRMIYIEWDDDSGHDSTYIVTRSVEKSKNVKVGIVDVIIYGKIAGIIAGILFVIAFITGYPIFRKTMKANMRIRVHCFLSLSAVIVACYHCIVYLISGYASVWYETNMLIAYATTIFMVLSTITGFIRKTIIKKMKYAHWKKIHLLFSILALLSLVAHIILLGSDFEWLRSI